MQELKPVSRAIPSLREVFDLNSVAIVGASGAPSGAFTFPTVVIRSLIDAGFPHVYPVNPKYGMVLGLRCYPSVRDIPAAVDHVIIGVPAENVLALLDDCAFKSVKSATFFTAGFSESNNLERVKLEQEILQKARQGGFRIIGPNCVGLFIPVVRLTNWVNLPLEPGRVAFISQSGGHAMRLPLNAGLRGVRFSKVVSYGNALDINESELLEYLADDPQTDLIACYIEGIKDGKRFIRSLHYAAGRKPVIIYKGGQTEGGSKAALGHTAALSTCASTFQAICRQVGALLVDNSDELEDVLVLMSHVDPLPSGNGVAVIGVGGGPSVMAGDEASYAGLTLPQLNPKQQEPLRQILPLDGSIFYNPIDAPNLLDPAVIEKTLLELANLPQISAFVYHIGFHPSSMLGVGQLSQNSFLNSFICAFNNVKVKTGKSTLITLGPFLTPDGMRDFLIVRDALVAGGLPVFHSFQGMFRALGKILNTRLASVL